MKKESGSPFGSQLIFTKEELKSGYKQWLETFNYASGSIQYLVRIIDEWSDFLQSQNIDTLVGVDAKTVRAYFQYLKNRRRLDGHGTLKNSTLNSKIYGLHKLSEYLLKNHQIILPVQAKYLIYDPAERLIFSTQEIKKLYRVADSDRLGIRDVAMLSFCYGCGLRRGECANLDIEDILFDRGLVYIRKTKTYWERLVPMTAKVKIDIENYLLYGRPLLHKGPQTKALMLSRRGSRVSRAQLGCRMTRLLQMADMKDPNRPLSLHNLRHSIATHLLQGGMKLDDIAQFLGHRTMKSTQIYTHIVHQIEANEAKAKTAPYSL